MMRPPGTHLIRLARAVLDEGTVTRVFEPLIADWQRECATVPRGRYQLCLVRGYASFVMSFALVLPGLWLYPVPARLAVSVLGTVALFTVCGIALQISLFWGVLGSHTVYLLPSSLAIALPLAMVPAAIVGRRFARAPEFELRALVARLTLLTMLALVPLLAWVSPHANQAWRDAAAPAGAVALRGMRELTVPELLSAQPPAERGLWRPRDWNEMRRAALVERASVLVMPITMGVFGLTLARIQRRGWAAVMLAAWIVAGFLWLPMGYLSGPMMSHGPLLAMAGLVGWLTRGSHQRYDAAEAR